MGWGMMRGILGCVCLFWCALLGAGCASRVPMPESVPVVVSVLIPDPGTDDASRRVSGTVVGRRVLTAAHVLVIDADGAVDMDWLEVRRAQTQVRSVHHGDLASVATMEDPGEPLGNFLHDWLAFEAHWRVDNTPPVWEMGDGHVVNGETLYAIRARGHWAGEHEVIRLRARVAESVNDEPMPVGMLFVSPRGRNPGRGWSGSFVGRYDAEADRWVFVGMLVGRTRQTNGRKLFIVIRPPEEVIRWLLEGDVSTARGGGG
ncbi:MAG: hypothetical protein EA378_02275 [Phycisphaerales bacterium]|nr:MAG: hypothetical protein EA378_02275 [Phycisphaerales bacterium]